MALTLTITDAGRAEIINADNTGTGPVTVAEIGFGSAQYSPTASQTALQNETKRISTIAGEVVADDTIHVTVKDESNDAYSVGEFGLYSGSGTLLAVYAQTSGEGWIIEKAAPSSLLLAVDIVLQTLNATSLTFGDTSFSNPQASETVKGVVELATDAETQAGTDTERAVTPAGLQSKVTQSITDTTSGRLLKVKDFGIGRTTGSIDTIDPNSYLTPSGYYLAPASGFGTAPFGTSAVHLFHQRAGSTAKQIALSADNIDRMKMRNYNSGAWSEWKEIYHTGNLTVQADVTDTTPGALLRIGAFGLGAQNQAINISNKDFNTILSSGFYASTVGPTNSPDDSQVYWNLIVNADITAGGSSQIAINRVSGEMYIRGRSSSTWGAWKKIASESWIKGLGIGDVATTYTANLNENLTSGRFAFNTGAIGRPFEYGTLDVRVRAGGELTQIAVEQNTGQVATRSRTAAGSWSTWSLHYGSGNSPFVAGNPGYEILANGRIRQFGTYIGLAQGATATITLPITFSNAALNVRANYRDLASGLATNYGAVGATSTTSQITIKRGLNGAGAGGSEDVEWEVIGH